MNRSKDEIRRLYNVSEWYSSGKGLDSKMIQYRVKTLLPYFKGLVILELGCEDGVMTEILVKHFKRIVAVGGSSKFCDTVEIE